MSHRDGRISHHYYCRAFKWRNTVSATTFRLTLRVVVCDQVNADDTVAILAEITSSLEEGATAVWALMEGVLDGYDDLSLAATSSLEYTVSSWGPDPRSTTRAEYFGAYVGLEILHNTCVRSSTLFERKDKSPSVSSQRHLIPSPLTRKHFTRDGIQSLPATLGFRNGEHLGQHGVEPKHTRGRFQLHVFSFCNV